MKILFVGDIHNHQYIFEDIKRLDKEYNFDKIICLGDYVDDWDHNGKNSIESLNKVIKLKQSNLNKYIFCLGNHELSYLGYPCSGHNYEYENQIKDLLITHINYFDLYAQVELDNKTYICTHAGIVNGYALNSMQVYSANWSIDNKNVYNNSLETLAKWNQNKEFALKLMSQCSYARGGSHPFGSFVWADKSEIMNLKEDLIIPYQIVGHSVVDNIKTRQNSKECVYFIDTHSTYPDGSKYGDKSYLMWDEDKFEIKY